MKLKLVLAGLALATPLVAGAKPLPPGDAAAGKAVVSRRCTMCHVTTKGAKPTVGPNLHGLIGRVSGTSAYKYRPALVDAKIRWTPKTLDWFLQDPKKRVPGTTMGTAVRDPQERANVIAYLQTLK